jgi:hypothetical protein
METNFILTSIQEEGRRANERFERALKTELPLDLQLLEGLDEQEISVEQLEKAAKEQAQPNAWPTSAAFDIAKGLRSEAPELTFADLQRGGDRDPLRAMVEKAVREELKRHASNTELDEEEEEPRETPQLPEDRGATRFDRDVENMRATIDFRVSEGADKAEAVAALRKVTANAYSQRVIDAAAA